MQLGDVHINRDGTIRYSGEAIGYVARNEGPLAQAMGAWRAEVGDAADPEAWPAYAVVYAPTRKEAVRDALRKVVTPA